MSAQAIHSKTALTGAVDGHATLPTIHSSARLEAAALHPLTHTSPVWYAWVGFLAIVVAWGAYAYSIQFRHGLIETGMRDVVIWGLYVTNFVFFIGISHAGTLISAILRVSHAEWRRPVTRMAEVITVVSLMIGALMPIIDLGRPDRVLNVILFGQIGSAILWDLISISTYLTGSLIYLYLPLIPDIALARDKLVGTRHWLRHRIYAALSLRWRGTPGQRRRLERALGVMMVVIIPVAVSVHTVVSWIFGMTMRDGWNSTVFGPYFVVGAIYSGTAGIISVMYLFRRFYHLEEYIAEKQFRFLGYLMLALGLIYAYFTFAEYLTTGYKLAEGDKLLLEALMLGRYALPFWTFVIAGMLVPILICALPWTRTIPLIVAASVLVNIGMWLKRYVIVVASLGLPQMPYEWGGYRPTWVEFSITAAAFAGFGLIFTLFAKTFPILSVWEIKEGWEHEGSRILAIDASHVDGHVDHRHDGVAPRIVAQRSGAGVGGEGRA